MCGLALLLGLIGVAAAAPPPPPPGWQVATEGGRPVYRWVHNGQAAALTLHPAAPLSAELPSWLAAQARRGGGAPVATVDAAPRDTGGGVWMWAGRVQASGRGAQFIAGLGCANGGQVFYAELAATPARDFLMQAIEATTRLMREACDRGDAALTLATPTPAAPTPARSTGSTANTVLLLSAPDPTAADAALWHTAQRRYTPLPRSALASSYVKRADTWAVAREGGTLVRQSARGEVSVFEASTRRLLGQFQLDAVPGARSPVAYGALRPSPDGQHLLGAWKRSDNDARERLVVFDRQGRVVTEGSDLRHDSGPGWQAMDWLPDGRIVHLAGERIVVRTVGGPSQVVGTLALPPGTRLDDATLRASPDGQRLLLSLRTCTRGRRPEPSSAAT